MPPASARLGAFLSEVDAGSRKENAPNKNLEPRSDSIGTEMALGKQALKPAQLGSISLL
jgi:hypothetical protein